MSRVRQKKRRFVTGYEYIHLSGWRNGCTHSAQSLDSFHIIFPLMPSKSYLLYWSFKYIVQVDALICHWCFLKNLTLQKVANFVQVFIFFYKCDGGKIIPCAKCFLQSLFKMCCDWKHNYREPPLVEINELF